MDNHDNEILKLNNFSLSFLSDNVYRNVVSNISLTVERGKTLGVVGESGSGKTVTVMSLIKLLNYPPAKIDSGEALFTDKDGNVVDLLALDEEKLIFYRGKKISCVFQNPMTSLNPSMKCGRQVTEVLDVKDKNEAFNETIKIFKEVGLPRPEHIFDSYPHQISGGQRQRVMIAIAIACKPDILIADEPTTALDVRIQKKIIDLLKNLQKKYNMSIIMISHNLGIIREIADYVVVMKYGKVVETGDVSSVFSNPKHPYTMGLLACRPPLHSKLKFLPTVEDIEEKTAKIPDFSIDSYIETLKLPVADTKIGAVNVIADDVSKHLDDAEILKVNNLVVRYAKHFNFFGNPNDFVYAVNDVSFKIRFGETLGILGESGCGKSTIAKTICNLLKPFSGEILFDNVDILKLHSKKRKLLCEKIQMVFQDPYSSLNPKITVGEALIEPLKVHNILDNYNQRKEKVLYLMSKVGLSPSDFYKYPYEFSGGQRQRICIARALTLDPKLLICDEPVSSLDVSVQAKVLNLLQQLKEDFNLSMLFITHDIAVVNHVADNVIIMKNGIIVEENTPFNIIENSQNEYTKSLISSSL